MITSSFPKCRKCFNITCCCFATCFLSLVACFFMASMTPKKRRKKQKKDCNQSTNQSRNQSSQHKMNS
uniref:Uncharacterized protein MANES_17G005400 n=1 Tax=Rhizophora mucronata TaxID=61149 RepID=A0A2P2L299_RHIMU